MRGRRGAASGKVSSVQEGSEVKRRTKDEKKTFKESSKNLL